MRARKGPITFGALAPPPGPMARGCAPGPCGWRNRSSGAPAPTPWSLGACPGPTPGRDVARHTRRVPWSRPKATRSTTANARPGDSRPGARGVTTPCESTNRPRHRSRVVAPLDGPPVSTDPACRACGCWGEWSLPWANGARGQDTRQSHHARAGPGVEETLRIGTRDLPDVSDQGGRTARAGHVLLKYTRESLAVCQKRMKSEQGNGSP